MRTLTIGRSTDSDIVIDDKTVSRRHAELVITQDGKFYLNDLHSRTGTSVWSGRNWEPIRQSYVDEGDRIKLGAWSGRIPDLIHMARRR